MPIALPVGIAVAAIASILIGSSHRYFAPDACNRLETALSDYVVGQPLGTKLITESICEHLSTKSPQKPLVLSIHGPPGVGKSWSHTIGNVLTNVVPMAS